MTDVEKEQQRNQKNEKQRQTYATKKAQKNNKVAKKVSFCGITVPIIKCIIIQDSCSHCGATHPGRGCGAISAKNLVPVYHVGGFTEMCNWCGAYLLPAEKKKNWNLCCAKGKVDLSDTFKSLQNPPIYLKELCDPTDKTKKISNKFLKNTKFLNSCFAMGSIQTTSEPVPLGGPQVCRINGDISFQLSDLICEKDQSPMFGQFYGISPEEALEIRLQIFGKNDDDKLTMKTLDDIFRKHHCLAKVYKLGREILEDEQKKAVLNGKNQVTCVFYVQFKNIFRCEISDLQKTQKDCRLTKSKDLIAALQRKLKPGETLGKVYFAPTSLRGSRAYMQKMYANAKTISRHIGKGT